MPFSELYIDMSIQTQIMSMHMLTSLLYKGMSEKHPSTGYPTVKHPNHKKLRVSCIREKLMILGCHLLGCSVRAQTALRGVVALRCQHRAVDNNHGVDNEGLQLYATLSEPLY